MVLVKTLDMYRKVPTDLLEGTKKGSFFSVCAVVSMATLFFMETRAFFKTNLQTDLLIDDSTEKKLRVNFNITMLDLSCDYTVVDVVSFLGTQQNITAHVNKWSLDEDGVKQRFQGRNRKQSDILFHDETVTQTIEELHRDGEQAEALDANSLEVLKKENKYLFVDYNAPWCSHCIKLGPTWETLAELMGEVASESVDEIIANHYPDGDHEFSEEDYHEAVKLQQAVKIGKVDCTKNDNLCKEQHIYGYPTLRLYVNGKFHSDFKGDRTVMAFTHYLEIAEKEDTKINGNDPDGKYVAQVNERALSRGSEHHHDRLPSEQEVIRQWKGEDHPGCQISGFLLLDRVPGNFHILARSDSKDLVPSMTNVSHEVHELYFGDPSMKRFIERGKARTPNDLLDKLQFTKGNTYLTRKEHSAYHHHLKIVSTNFDYTHYSGQAKRTGVVYQLLAQSQLTHYGRDQIPEAKFIYDLSPVAIRYRRTSRKWYDYLTSIMAIIGGTFTVVGMLESSVHYAAKNKKRR